MENCKLVITDLKQGVKNPNRVNVFVDSKYAFSLDVAQVVDLGVKIGRELSVEEFEEFKKASEFGKLYQRTLEWVLIRPRSVRETRDYLIKKLKTPSSDSLLRARRHGAQSLTPLPVGRGQSSEDVFELSEKIIQRLLDKKYLNDYKFAEWYVENRFVKKGISKKRLKMELIKKGIVKDIIDEVLDGRNDEEEIRKMINKKREKYDDEKLMAYLVRQGFSYDLVRRMVLDE
ncbi:RecX family transcriptional regulator [Candidatus Saccharibacteria bacterium]|nr:RecX family transcriptional regulator [Candidatus Saccharibacteria bacterium]